MAIPQTRYVIITSGVIGASGVQQRDLIGRRHTTDPRVPIGSILMFASADDVISFFGSGSPEAKFALKYFAYISPLPASRAQGLQFAAYAPAGRAPVIFGAAIAANTLATMQAITAGTLSLQLGGTPAALTGLNFSAAVSLANVATILQTAIRAQGGTQYANATVTYNALTGSFTITGDTVATAVASVTVTGGNNDVAIPLRLSGVGSIASPGVAAQTMLDAFLAAEAVTDSFGSVSFATQGSLDEISLLAQYIDGLNVKYQFHVSVTNITAQAVSAALISISSVGLNLNITADQLMESLPQAMLAATDYQRTNATINYMFRRGTYVGEVLTNADANIYDALRVNYYGVTASAGQQISFYQRGFLCGGINDPLDMNVFANEQWLKSKLAADLLNLQLSLNKIPANLQGANIIRAEIMQAVQQAKRNGTISLDKTLTQVQKSAIYQLTNDPDAWHDVQTAGYWLDVVIEPYTQEPSGVQSYVAKYTLAYSKNDVIRKIEGSHNLV
jgi:hypothetical protein